MAAIAPFTLQTDEATPQNRIFDPLTSGLPSVWRANIAGLQPSLQPTVTLSMRNIGKSKALRGIKAVVRVPVAEVVTGANSSGYSAAPKEAYAITYTVEAILPTRAGSQERKDAKKFVAQLMAVTQIHDAFTSEVVPY